MREIKLRMQVLQAARRLSRAAHAERCHWRRGVIIMWKSLRERRATMQVMLEVSLWAIWDATLVYIIIAMIRKWSNLVHFEVSDIHLNYKLLVKIDYLCITFYIRLETC